TRPVWIRRFWRSGWQQVKPQLMMHWGNGTFKLQLARKQVDFNAQAAKLLRGDSRRQDAVGKNRTANSENLVRQAGKRLLRPRNCGFYRLPSRDSELDFACCWFDRLSRHL